MFKLISNQTRTMYGTYLELMYLSRVYGLKGRQFKIVHVAEKGVNAVSLTKGNELCKTA